MERKTYEHPSYGVINSSRVSSSKSSYLFGSGLKTNHTITLKITPAVLHRELNHDWIHSRGLPLIEIEMTENQWAQFLSSSNVGEGTPVTIRYVGGVKVDDPPLINKIDEFNSEFKDSMKNLADKMGKLAKESVQLLSDKKNLNKMDREVIIKGIESLIMQVSSSFPYISESFSGAMDKIVIEAKTQIQTYYERLISEQGLKAISDGKLDINLLEKGNE